MKVWKWLFFILLIFNIAVLAAAMLMLSQSYEAPQTNDNYTESDSGIKVRMDNQAVESLIMDNMGDEPLDISISESGIALTSEHSVYGLDIVTDFNLEPVSTGDSIVFEVTDIDISDLPLTQDMLYSIIRSSSNLPEGLSFSEDSRALVVDTSSFTDEMDMSIKSDSIDYENNEWYFSIER
ncbi:DUF2140 family protein [Salinicoccus albus]|uniref:DUF2140 family protein n=1 Tax=Salinicoccus albus TaxID=418756 RepID=UPI000376E84F|nr:DUF2140 family protein [Salinicoccus albus]